eukprot:TRINITY_DN38842_c0_g1_i1.p1 TRINITY_DN38842_c0_g1~~TRINITY_DN38842_c0_g1_i1.p1  ORF type:complete len:173 (+),score=27.11 TRINITY_DN38842_c0_g1_i1:38-520(+)
MVNRIWNEKGLEEGSTNTRTKMLERRIAETRDMCHAFEVKMRTAKLGVSDLVGGDSGFFTGKKKKAKAGHTRRRKDTCPSVSIRSDNANKKRSSDSVIDIKYPYPPREPRYLHLSSSNSMTSHRSLLDNYHLPLYSSFTPSGEYTLPPLPSLYSRSPPLG